MHDRVADVLRQRATLESGPGLAVAISLLLHGGLTALAIYTALHQPAPQPVSTINIQFAQSRRATPPAPAPAPVTPKVVEAKPAAPKQAELPKEPTPQPEPPKPTPKPPEKNTVPLSPFGQSTKKGSENPAPKTATPPPVLPSESPAGTTTAPEVAVGGSGVTGLEGGDFPYTIYLEAMQRKIGSNWFRAPSTAPGTTAVVYFRIQRNGTITDVQVKTKSGNGTFDRAAMSAVLSSSPLNPLPFNYQGQYLGVHLTFR